MSAWRRRSATGWARSSGTSTMRSGPTTYARRTEAPSAHRDAGGKRARAPSRVSSESLVAERADVSVTARRVALLAGVLLFIVSMGWSSAPAQAHALLVASTPADGDSLDEP